MKQADAPMKVGTDAMVLGASIDVTNKTKGLEIGAGTGVISLMLVQQNKSLTIQTLEIDELASKEAAFNFSESSWSNQLKSECIDFLDFQSDEKYDLIFSNPPYFISALLNKDERMANAKHEVSLPIQPFFNKVQSLLSPLGIFWLIIPKSDEDRWITEANAVGLFLNTMKDVSGKPNTKPNRVILSFNQNETNNIEQSFLTIRKEDGRYSEDYIELTKDFHWKDLSKG